MTARELIDRMKAANAAGNFGIPDGIVSEWTARQEAGRQRGEAHYTRLVDPTTNAIIAEVND